MINNGIGLERAGKPAQRRWNFPGYRSRRASMPSRPAMGVLGLCDNWNHSKTGVFGGEIGCHKSARRSIKKRTAGCGMLTQGRGRRCSRFVLFAPVACTLENWPAGGSRQGGAKILAGAFLYKRGLRKIFQKNQTCITLVLCNIAGRNSTPFSYRYLIGVWGRVRGIVISLPVSARQDILSL